MLWKTHIKITFSVFRELGIYLSDDEKERVKEGVIAPDKWGLADTPHHYGKEKKICDYLLLSRKYFLRYDLLGAYYYLGIALHYIQDSYVSMASFYPKHHSWEESIENSTYESDLQKTIRYWLRNNSFERDRCLGIASSLTIEVQGRDNTLYIATLSGHKQLTSYAKPIIDYNLGFRASYLVAKSVLSPRSSTELDFALKQLLKYYENLLHESESSSSTEIIDIVNQVENLKRKKTAKSGFVPKLKNGFLSLKVKVKEFQLNSKYNNYLQKRHLFAVYDRYKEAAKRIINPHIGWYNFHILEKDIRIIKSELIPIQEALRNFDINEEVLAVLIWNGRINCYKIGNKKLVNRREVHLVLKA